MSMLEQGREADSVEAVTSEVGYGVKFQLPRV
ncbi:hypothetical protein ABIE00_002945 [Arthrobacter sp. OAP107]